LIRARKSLGQHFLVDRGVARRIVDAVSPQTNDLIFEIGPGTGALTGLIVERCGLVIAVEIDDRLAAELRGSTTNPRLLIVQADALELDWDGALSQGERSWREILTGAAGAPRVRIVANLPYYISSAIIARLLPLWGRLFDMTLMLQKEVVERITARPGGRDYGYLTVMVEYYATSTRLFNVGPSAFRPVPRVESSVVSILFREKPAVDVDDPDRFFRIVQAGFAHRRKNLFNNLRHSSDRMGSTGRIEEALKRAGIDGRRRAETLSIEEFAGLYHELGRD
jgi:16S rRNA (adenine1518-N6/adenine1519-N6)-dimethyltransferase